jgi:hypothetical protein
VEDEAVRRGGQINYPALTALNNDAIRTPTARWSSSVNGDYQARWQRLWLHIGPVTKEAFEREIKDCQPGPVGRVGGGAQHVSPRVVCLRGIRICPPPATTPGHRLTAESSAGESEPREIVLAPNSMPALFLLLLAVAPLR